MHCISIFTKGAFFVVVSMLLFTSCHQTASNNLLAADDAGNGYASDASRIEWASDDIISIADIAGTINNGAYIGSTNTVAISNCATVGTDTISIPHTLTIRFGNTDCLCTDGKNRRGTIIVTYNGEYTDPAQAHTITFDNYFLSENQMTGSIVTTRVDTPITGNWYYNVQMNDSLNMSQDPLNSQYVIWTGNLVRKWVAGYLPNLDRTQQVFSISGSATLVRPNGHAFSFGIATPIQIAHNCEFAESGVVNVTGYTGARVLNYGNGNCDAVAQLSIGVTVNQLTLVQ